MASPITPALYDLSRLRAPAVCLAASFLALAIVGLAIRPAVSDPRLLPEDAPIGRASLVEDGGPRIVAAQRALAREATPTRLGLMLGSSTLPYSVEPEELGLGDRWRWLSLKALGGDVGDVATLGELALKAGLRPEVVVLVLNPGMFVSTPGPPASPWAAIRRNLAKRRLRGLIDSVEDLIVMPWNRMFPDHDRISNALSHLLYDAKFTLMRRIGLDLGAIHAPAPRPWDRDPGDPVPEGTPAVRQIQQEAFQLRGWFDPDRYRADSRNTRSILRFMRQARSLGAIVIVVFPPEGSTVRTLVPPAAVASYASAAASEFGAGAPALIDARDMVDDAMFIDLVHLGERGRRSFSRRLGDLLRERLGPRPPD